MATAFKRFGPQLDIFDSPEALSPANDPNTPPVQVQGPAVEVVLSNAANALQAEAAARSAVMTAEPVSRVIEDAGEELKFNRRNRNKTGKRWDDIAHLNDTLKVKEAVKGNIWPKPDYKALIDAGMQPMVAHIVKQVYDSVAVKPVVGRGALDDVALQRYIGALDRVERGVMAWATDSVALKAWVASNARTAGSMLGRSVNISDLAGESETLLDKVYPGGYKLFRDELMIGGGNKLLGALQPRYDEIRKAMKALEKGWPEKREAWEVQGFRVVENPSVVVEKHPSKEGCFLLGVEDRFIKSYESQVDADAAAAGIRPFVLFNKRSMVDSFASEDEAVEAAKERTRREKSGAVGEKGLSVLEVERVGVSRRMEGEDVSAERVMAEFGLKGVNFGNWMKTPAARAEAQLHLNHAFDAFHDLAEIMGVPPKAMSLNGMLGLAIGAQGGGGGAAAHFVAGLNEINLTRTCGAGALGHEWAHALDHYFAAKGGLASEERPFLTVHATLGMTKAVGKTVDGKYVREEVPRFGDLRPEMVSAFKAVVDAMDKREQTEAEMRAGFDERLVKAQKNVDNWLKGIRRDFAGQEEAFDVLAARVRAGDVGDGRVAMGRDTMITPVVAEIRELYKAQHGRVYSIDNIKGLQAWVDQADFQVKRIAADEGLAPLKVRVSTQFARNAVDLDKGKGGKPYWSTPLEKFARSFDAFVSDELEARQAKNGYLSHTGRADETVPVGEDRVAVNSAFRALVGEIQVRETEKGVALASFVGEKAFLAEKYALANARELIRNGGDAESVRQETGWFQGVDKKWRFEINDADAKLVDGLAHKGYPVAPQASKLIVKLDRPLVLSDILDHPALFAAYPALADYGVTFVPAKTISGSASISGKQILVSDALPGLDVESALLHEIQHGIQHIEGFATGGNEKTAMSALVSDEARRSIALNTVEKIADKNGHTLTDAQKNDIAEQVFLWEGSDDNKVVELEKTTGLSEFQIAEFFTQDPFEMYRRLAGEVEARNTQARQKMTPESRRAISPAETQDVSNADAIVVFNGKPVASMLIPANMYTEVQKALPLPAIRMEIERLRKTWKSMPPVTVVNTVAELPFKLAAHSDGAHCDGHVYVVASNIKDMKQLQKVMAHECVMHHSLQEMLGNYGFAKLNHGIQTLIAKGDPVVCELAAEIKIRYGVLPAESETKEIVARAGEKCLDADGQVKIEYGFMKSVYAGAANWLRDKGFKIPFTNTELQGIMHDAGKWIERDRVKGWQVGGAGVALSSLDSASVKTIALGGLMDKAQKTIVVDGVERPAQNSKGQPIHATMEGVRNFWREMGDTKAVDGEGRPLVMVHGTFSGDIDKFKGKSSWFAPGHDTSEADIIVANGRLLPNADPDNYPDVGENAVFYPVFLNIKNPAPSNIADAFYNGELSEDKIKKMGYDGLEWDDGVLVVFDSTQIKSAIGNRGDFNQGNPKILCSLADVQSIEVPVPDVVKSGSFTGRILDVLGGIVFQSKGREGGEVRHDASKLSEVPKIDAVVRITYVGDQGEVTDLNRKAGIER